ncbi:MAG: DUF1385 domain-containing protein, partial [Oscillospiraceae bacterium]|nr:DUF1385 domain-containing protein [Oscillospiraceae bacterium]
VFVRGVFNFVLQLKNGYSYMMKSMEVSGLLDEEESNGDAIPTDLPESVEEAAELIKAGAVPAGDVVLVEKKSGIAEAAVGVIGTVFGIALGLGLFMFLPTYAVTWLDRAVPAELEGYRSLIEGVIRIILFVAYMWAISLMKDIRRTYEYHGAEHKVIAAYEAGETLDAENVDNVKPYKRFHARCGTSFIFLVLTISILIYSALSIPGLPMNVATIAGWLGEGYDKWAKPIRISIQILSTPFIVAITYELIKLAGRYDRNPFMRALSAPGLWLQRLTVFEPNDEQLQVAVSAMLPVIPQNEKEKKEDKW